ncbi:unnamed protein product [Schistocephalus solidus]|uniref:Uncharacterized protein n=1 Tax=Schistocephalus solidus TaxID=70667 RepID=A0A183T4L6_SCHSO|nr:unnamed protein product [Schistocephalus solidus]
MLVGHPKAIAFALGMQGDPSAIPSHPDLLGLHVACLFLIFTSCLLSGPISWPGRSPDSKKVESQFEASMSPRRKLQDPSLSTTPISPTTMETFPAATADTANGEETPMPPTWTTDEETPVPPSQWPHSLKPATQDFRSSYSSDRPRTGLSGGPGDVLAELVWQFIIYLDAALEMQVCAWVYLERPEAAAGSTAGLPTALQSSEHLLDLPEDPTNEPSVSEQHGARFLSTLDDLLHGPQLATHGDGFPIRHPGRKHGQILSKDESMPLPYRPPVQPKPKVQPRSVAAPQTVQPYAENTDFADRRNDLKFSSINKIQKGLTKKRVDLFEAL